MLLFDLFSYLLSPCYHYLVPVDLQLFKFGTEGGKPADHLTRRHAYVLQPITGNAKYTKMRSGESADNGQPLQKVLVNLDDVTLCLSKVMIFKFSRFWLWAYGNLSTFLFAGWV